MINFDLQKYLSPTFIKTGTGLAGHGIKKAIEAGFKRIISIEISEELYLRASDTFRDEIMDGLVEIRFGNSTELLPFILDEIKERVTFWLDALDEMEAIKNHPIKNHTIIIDDRRLFAENEIITRLMDINPNYKIVYEDRFKENDIIVAFTE